MNASSAPILLALTLCGPLPGQAGQKKDAFSDVQMQELSPKEWLRQVEEKLSARYGVSASDLHFSPPPPKLAAFLRGPPAPASGSVKRKRGAGPRRYQIVVVDVEGQKRGQYRAVTARGSDEPPQGLRFLDDNRLIYEATAPAPSKPRPTRHAARPAKGAGKRSDPQPPDLPRHLFVIQPVGRRARPIRCEGVRFAFTGKRDRIAFVGGSNGGTFVSVNGARIYPRRGGSVIASDLAWSRDGFGLAFLELPAKKPARLVLIATFDDPRSAVTWDLPEGASWEGAHVSWAGTNKLVVSKAGAKPLFTASFARQDPTASDSFNP